jgi:hypothetical protein
VDKMSEMTRRKFIAASALAGAAASASMPGLSKALAATVQASLANGPQSVDLLVMGPDIGYVR